MDDAVLTAMAKWPNVPACYGWLALDARGHWRLGAPGQDQADIVRHRGLADFLGRNYARGNDGAWFCQNGPQRAYVDLDCAPWVVRLDSPPGSRLRTHTGLSIANVETAYLADDERLYLLTEHGLGVVDDRDLAAIVSLVGCIDPTSDRDELLIEAAASAGDEPSYSGLQLRFGTTELPLLRIASGSLPARHGFVRRPHPAEP